MVGRGGNPLESCIRTMAAKAPVFGAFSVRFALESRVSAPTVPPLGCAVVRMIVTPAPPGVQVGHIRVAPLPFCKTRSPSVIQYVPGKRLIVPLLNDNPPEICVLADRVYPLLIALPAICQRPHHVDPGFVQVGEVGMLATRALWVSVLE